jgi:hypothetical protein
MADPYESGVLDRTEHDRMVADIAKIARDANLRPEWIWARIEQHCTAGEIEWVRRFPFHKSEGRAGLCLVGKHPAPAIEDRMSALAGTLVRNFVRARLMTVHQVIEAVDDGQPPEMSCLLVPNFFLGKIEGALPAWRLALLLDGLLNRKLRGLQTVLYVTDLVTLGKEYGMALRQHLEAHYQLLGADL